MEILGGGGMLEDRAGETGAQQGVHMGWVRRRWWDRSLMQVCERCLAGPVRWACAEEWRSWLPHGRLHARQGCCWPEVAPLTLCCVQVRVPRSAALSPQVDGCKCCSQFGCLQFESTVCQLVKTLRINWESD